jgi:hypothetical protein
MEMHIGRAFTINERRRDGSKVDNQAAADAIMVAIAELLPTSELRGDFADLDSWQAKVGDVRCYDLDDATSPLDEDQGGGRGRANRR